MKQPLSNASSAKSSWLANYGWKLAIGIIGLIIALLVANFLYTYKKVPAPSEFRLTTQAKKNEFFVSQRLLESWHKNVKIDQGEIAHRELKAIWQQPANQAQKTAVILLTVSKEQESDIPAMLNWIERGGHLVTFSQDALINETSDDENLDEYKRNENVLLNFLGIKNIDINNPNDELEAINHQIASMVASTPVTNFNDRPKQKGVSLGDEKALMRLPLIENHTTNQPTPSYIGVVIATTNHKHLDTTQFWQKYPQAKAIGNYNWFNQPQNLNDLTLINDNNWQSLPLTDSQLNQLKQKIVKEPKTFIPADKALLDVKIGQGRLTIANDDQIFTNPNGGFLTSQQEKQQQQTQSQKPQDTTSTTWQALLSDTHSVNIAEYDNAYLLKYLLIDRQQVWLVPNTSVPNLITLLWRNLKWACLAFVVCIIAGILALPKRFGRWQSYRDDSQTNIFGYFDHVGEYFWQYDQAQALVAQNRERLLDKIIATYPQLSKIESQSSISSTPTMPTDTDRLYQIDRQKICQLLSEQLGMSFERVALALFADWKNDTQFLQISREFAVLNRYFHQKITHKELA